MSAYPLHDAASSGQIAKIQKVLARGCAVDSKDKVGATALLHAAYFGNLDATRYLVEHGADINAPNKNGYRPLMAASRAGCVQIVAYLVSQDVDVDCTTDEGFTALHFGIIYSPHAQIASLLLQAQSDPNSADIRGLTPLMAAAFRGDTTIIQELLTFGADPSTTNPNGETALDYALKKENTDAIALLQDAPAS